METPVGTSPADARENVRSWLSTRKIEPILFQSEATEQVIFLEIQFSSPDDARLFERDFLLGSMRKMEKILDDS